MQQGRKRTEEKQDDEQTSTSRRADTTVAVEEGNARSRSVSREGLSDPLIRATGKPEGGSKKFEECAFCCGALIRSGCGVVPAAKWARDNAKEMAAVAVVGLAIANVIGYNFDNPGFSGDMSCLIPNALSGNATGGCAQNPPLAGASAKLVTQGVVAVALPLALGKFAPHICACICCRKLG